MADPQAGASGFLFKDVEPEPLLAGIRAVHAGESPLAPMVTRRMIETFLERPPVVAATAARRPLASLTAREQEVLRLLGAGAHERRDRDGAVVSETTVKTMSAGTTDEAGIAGP